jgi:serine/threonine-protein kinase RsbW
LIAEKTEILLPSKLESVDKAAVEAARLGERNGLDEGALFAIDMAVREAVANAIKHGNKLDESQNIELTFSNSPESFEITVRDFGSGFTVDDVADCTAEENLLKASGRGIHFMRSFMDEVEWSNPPGGGTMVKMAKKR